jgi:hypothetical protein
MAEPAADVGAADVSPLRSWIVRHPIATFLVLVYATTTALVFAPQGADRARTSPWGSDTARDTGERPRVGGASIYRCCPGEREGWRAGPRPAQLPLAGAAALVSDQPARSAADLLDRRHDPVWLRALAQNWLLLFTAFLPALAIMIVLNNVAEEIGWTGFVFARFQDRHGPLALGILLLPHLSSRLITG